MNGERNECVLFKNRTHSFRDRMQRSFIIGVVGARQAGKKTMIRRITTGEFVLPMEEQRLAPPQQEQQLTSYTNIMSSNGRPIEVKLDFEIATIATMRESGIARRCDAFIFMIDTTDAKQDIVAPIINHHLSSLCCKPSVICLNKIDIPRIVGIYRLTERDFNLSSSGACVIETSYRSNYNFEKPFLFLAKRLLHTDNLKMTCYESLTEFSEDYKESPRSAFQFSLDDDEIVEMIRGMSDEDVEAFARRKRSEHPEYKYLSDEGYLGVIGKQVATGTLDDLGLLWLEVQRRLK